jgi:hypothetical protein
MRGILWFDVDGKQTFFPAKRAMSKRQPISISLGPKEYVWKDIRWSHLRFRGHSQRRCGRGFIGHRVDARDDAGSWWPEAGQELVDDGDHQNARHTA